VDYPLGAADARARWHMKITNEKKPDVLLNLLKERYEASHKMRDRSLSFAIWVMGFGIVLIWILVSGPGLGLGQKIILTSFVLVAGGLTRKFLKSIETGFKNNHEVMVKIETILGCYRKNIYVKNDSVFPDNYKTLSNKDTSHFGSIYTWLVVMGFVLILMIWLSPCH